MSISTTAPMVFILAAIFCSCTNPEHDGKVPGQCTPVFLLGAEPVVPDSVILTETTPGSGLFRLCVVQQDEWELDEHPLRLVAGDKEWKSKKRHRLPSGKKRHLGIWINEPELAETLSRSLDIPVAKRMVPKPYELNAEFFAEAETFAAGDRIPIRLRLVNTGSTSVRVAQNILPAGSRRHPGFTVKVKCNGESLPETTPEGEFVGVGTRRVVEPGDVVEERIFVNDWVAPDRKGDYAVSLTYSLNVDGTPWPFDTAACCSALRDNFVECFKSEVCFTVK